MATVVLSAVGSAVGGAVGGSVLGVSSVAIGQAVGAIAGSFIDQKLLGSGSVAVETGKARSLRVQTSTEGTAIAQVFGRMRVAGQVIWSSRFKENRSTRSEGGGKGNPGRRVTEFSYTISLAVGLCEGPIQRIGRVWADGKLLSLSGIRHRIYLGNETQTPDPKIQAVEGHGTVPAYRGLAYVVFEDLPLERFGNHIPQLNFEVFRSAQSVVSGANDELPVPKLVKAVTLSPGTGEFALDPQPAREVFPAGGGKYLNINSSAGAPDLTAALNQLDNELDACENVSLIVSWFGDDLRCGSCRVEPRIEQPNRVTSPSAWTSSGLTAATARSVSRDPDDRVNFGGTPDDGSIIRAIRELKARGKNVTIYPFLLMDIPGGNGLPDPYGAAEQPAFPWRGRITLNAAPGQAGSTDKTAAAQAEVANFFGTAQASNFAVSGDSVSYSGPDEWTWRRFVLHLAALSAAAGGVDSICIGTELRGLTTIRSGVADFPAVDHLIALAAEVRTLLPSSFITYAADWSEYFGYHPQDGSGDVLFHLDPLWANSNVDAIGIDDYTPLSDWRHFSSHADAFAKSPYDLDYLRSQVEGGEYYDYFYASEADRVSQNRAPIEDGAFGEPWIFRAKDVRGWWSNSHHNRIAGVRQSTPTAWVPESKPVWLTETGCPAVDLGANKPNLFIDTKSSESGLPAGSRGARDDEMQRRFLQAKLGYWEKPSNNPISAAYGGPMIPTDRIYVWTWDARPWPDFPVRESVWSDGPSHRLGHWITGRVTASALSEVITEICLGSGLKQGDFDVSQVSGAVDGYVLDRTRSAREALQPLMQIHGIDAYESGGVLIFASRGTNAVLQLETERLAAAENSEQAAVTHEVGRETELVDQVRLSYVQAENDYRIGAAETRVPTGRSHRISESSMPVSLPGSKAQQVVDRWLSESNRANETVSFALPQSAVELEPGDTVRLNSEESGPLYRIDRITDAISREVEASRTESALYIPTVSKERNLEPELENTPGPLDVLIMDLPIADGSEKDHQPWIAATADPWPGEVAVLSSATGSNFRPVHSLFAPATMGHSLEVLPAAEPNRWQRTDWIVLLPNGSVASAERLDVLNGDNLLALDHGAGWEILQFETAELIDRDTYRISSLLRGQRGTEFLAKSSVAPGARVVLLDATVEPLPLTSAECGLPRTWRIGPANLDITDITYQQLDFGSACVGLLPFAPAHLRARKTGNDVRISWVRTTRIGGDSLEAFEVPQSDPPERYQLSIRQSGGILRQIELPETEYIYTETEQQADGAVGVITISVRQFSGAAGFGLERTLEIDV